MVGLLGGKRLSPSLATTINERKLMSILQHQQELYESKKRAKLAAQKRSKLTQANQGSRQYHLRQTSYTKIEERIRALRETKR